MSEVTLEIVQQTMTLAVTQASGPAFTATTMAGPSIVVGDTLGLSDLTPVTKTANYTATADQLVLANAVGGSFTVTTPTASGALSAVYKTDTSPNPVTINMGGGNTATLYQQDQARIMVGDGTRAWAIANRNPYGYADFVDVLTKVANYTLTMSEMGVLIEYNSTSAGTFTIPAFATIPWVDGCMVKFRTINTGQLTVAHATSTAHLKPYPAGAFKSAGQNASILATYKASGDLWFLEGALTT
jgi:hypothetical protein